jgi:hypothetical protein
MLFIVPGPSSCCRRGRLAHAARFVWCLAQRLPDVAWWWVRSGEVVFPCVPFLPAVAARAGVEDASTAGAGAGAGAGVGPSPPPVSPPIAVSVSPLGTGSSPPHTPTGARDSSGSGGVPVSGVYSVQCPHQQHPRHPPPPPFTASLVLDAVVVPSAPCCNAMGGWVALIAHGSMARAFTPTGCLPGPLSVTSQPPPAGASVPQGGPLTPRLASPPPCLP